MKASKSVLPVESQRKHLIPQQRTVTTHVKCCLLTKFIRNSAPRVFAGGWSHRHPLPSMFQNSRFPKGKLVFRRNHTVQKVQAQCTTLTSSANERNLPEIQVSRCQSRATSQTGISKDRSFQSAALTLFCTHVSSSQVTRCGNHRHTRVSLIHVQIKLKKMNEVYLKFTFTGSTDKLFQRDQKLKY